MTRWFRHAGLTLVLGTAYAVGCEHRPLAPALADVDAGNDQGPAGLGGTTNPASSLDAGVERGGTGGGNGSAPPCAQGSVFHLAQRGNIAAPIPDPDGITHDGQGFWLISGGHNAARHTLVRFLPESLVVDRMFGFDNLIGTQGSGVYGLAWDGESIWISVAGNTNKLVRVDPVTGLIRQTMSSPTELGPSDLDFDGEDLWLSSGTGTVFKIDRATGGIKTRFQTSPASLGRDHGVAVFAGEVWVGNLFGGMEVHAAATGALLGTVSHDDDCALVENDVGPSCFVNGQLVIASTFGITTYDVQR